MPSAFIIIIMNKDDIEKPWCIEEKWRRNVKICRKQIIACLNPLELLSYFDSRKLLSSCDKDILLMDTKPREDKVSHILEVLETTDKRDPYTIFIKCLGEEVQQKEGFHMGHEYLLAILKREQYASEDKFQASEASKECILRHRSDLHDIDLSSLVPVMYAHNLVTVDEKDMILECSNKPHKARIGQVLQILDTKGPLAYAIFEQCLGEEKSHPTHSELHGRIISRKRQHNPDNLGEVCSIPKRNPQRLRLEKPFCGKMYSEFIASIKECYQTSSWVELESLAQSFILQNNDPQLKAMAMIEKGYSFSCRKGMREKALECLSEARIIARQINGSNYFFLLARCKHIGATILRYSGKDDESLEENNVAFDLLSDCEPGDDVSRVMYGIACARLEKLGKTHHNPPLREINEIRAYFDFCVGHGSEGTPGLCASEARCLIRLAQMSLGTTTDGKCWATATQGDIKKAESYLKQVDASSISRRCQALYYVIESDLFKSIDNTTKAIESSEKALKIANESQLGAERHFAESRLQVLQA